MQDLLDDVAKDIKENDSLDSLQPAIRNIFKKPNEARKNMYSAIEYLDRNQQQPAREIVGARVVLAAASTAKAAFQLAHIILVQCGVVQRCGGKVVYPFINCSAPAGAQTGNVMSQAAAHAEHLRAQFHCALLVCQEQTAIVMPHLAALSHLAARTNKESSVSGCRELCGLGAVCGFAAIL